DLDERLLRRNCTGADRSPSVHRQRGSPASTSARCFPSWTTIPFPALRDASRASTYASIYRIRGCEVRAAATNRIGKKGAMLVTAGSTLGWRMLRVWSLGIGALLATGVAA